MKLQRLIFKNWMSFSEADINLSQVEGAVLLLGRYPDGLEGESNGAGKSSVLDSIPWALFGESRAPSDDDLIRLGQDEEMSVTIVFKLDGKEYEILRRKKFGKSQKLQFTDLTDDVKLTGNSIRETQSKIIETLGMDHKIFTSTVFCPQHEVATFAGAKPSERKEVLSTILNLDAYGEYEDKARSLANSYEGDANTIRAAITRADEELERIVVSVEDISKSENDIKLADGESIFAKNRIEQIRKEMDSLRVAASERKTAADDLRRAQDDAHRNAHQLSGLATRQKNEVESVDNDRKQFEDTISTGEKLQPALDEVESKIRDMVGLLERTVKARDQIATVKADRGEKSAKFGVLAGELEKLRKRIKEIHSLGAECPLCTSKLPEEKRISIEQEIQSEGLGKRNEHDALQKEIEGLDKKVEFLEFGLKNIREQAQEQQELEQDRDSYRRRILEVDMARTQLKSLDERMKNLDSHYELERDELTSEADKIRARMDDANAKIGKLSTFDQEKEMSLNEEIRDLETKISTLTLSRNEASERLGYLRRQKETADRLRTTLDTDKSKLVNASSKEFVYKELTRAFGRNGIPALIMDGALAEIQEEVSLRLDRLSRGRIQVEFVTTKELKSRKKEVETLDIRVTDEVGTRDFALYSGGEKVRVALAIRLALSRVISRRAGKRIESVFIDEISDLDAAGLDSFAGMIGEIRSEYAQVFVVTHFSELKNHFPQVLTVLKDSKGSRIGDTSSEATSPKKEAVAA